MQIHLGSPGFRKPKVSLNSLSGARIRFRLSKRGRWIRPARGGEVDDSILDALSPIPSDYSPMGSEEYEAACQALDEELGIMNQLSEPKEVLAIVTEVDRGGSESEKLHLRRKCRKLRHQGLRLESILARCHL